MSKRIALFPVLLLALLVVAAAALTWMNFSQALPRTLRKVCTCIAQTNETSAIAKVVTSCGRKPTKNSSTISARMMSWRQCTFSMHL